MKLVHSIPLLLLIACSAPDEKKENTSDTLKSSEKVNISDSTNQKAAGASLERTVSYYNGLIGGKYSIEVTLSETKDSVTGQYRYTSQTAYLTLKGTIKEGLYEILEFDPFGKNTGSFKGKKNSNNEIQGKWSNGKRTFDFVFTPKVADEYVGAVTVSTKEIQAKQGDCVCADLLVPFIVKASSPEVIRNMNENLKVENFTFGDGVENICECSEYGFAYGITSGYFDVLYNKGNILSIQWCGETMGAYPSGYCTYKNLDVRTGKLITDLKAVYSEEGIQYILEKTNIVVNDNLQEVGNDPEIVEDAGDWIKDLTQKRNLTFDDLKEFSFGDKGLTICYSIGFPHAIRCYEPGGDVEFTYSELEKWRLEGGVLGSK